MTEIIFTDELKAELIKTDASDDAILWAAKVSTGADLKPTSMNGKRGLIDYLIKSRHGSPFEHVGYTFRCEAPIFVVREAMRHRIASYNETSGRYREMEPKFYNYPSTRPLVQAGSGAHPDLQHGDQNLHSIVTSETERVSRVAWESYQYQLNAGAAKEVARAVLPLNTYTTWYVTMNARALMNFLSLRVDDDLAMFPTKPQWEIQKLAEAMEEVFRDTMPETWASFNSRGRVAP